MSEPKLNLTPTDERYRELATELWTSCNYASGSELREGLVRVIAAARAEGEAKGRREAIDALEPFAEIGAWLFARDLPDETPLVTINAINGVHWHLTRGHFKAAHTACRALAEPPVAEEKPT